MTATFFDHLSKDFTELLNDKEECNVMIDVGEGHHRQTFRAHSAVLRFRSSYFRRELMNVDKNRGVKRIVKDNVSPRIFIIILRYIYGGFVKFDDIETSTLFDLTIKSSEFEFEEMASFLETYLLDNKIDWLRRHFPIVCNGVYNQLNLRKLKKFCNTFIIRYPDLIFESEDFNYLRESSLVSLLKRDDLQLEEAQIWDKVIQWGSAHTHNLPENLENWNPRDFKALKSTLVQCLPHIRYFQFSVDDVFDRLLPYKRIIERTVWRDLAVRLADPERPVKTVILPPRKKAKSQTPQPSSSKQHDPQSYTSQFPEPDESYSTSQLNTQQSYTSQFSQPYASQSLSQPFTQYASQSHASNASQSFSAQTSNKLYTSQPSSRSPSTHPYESLQSYKSQPYASQSSSPPNSRSPTPQLVTKIEPDEEQLSLDEEDEENFSDEEVFKKGKSAFREGITRLLAKGKLSEEQSLTPEGESFLETTNESASIQPSQVESEMQSVESRTEPFFSTVITEDHVLEISSWIDRKENLYESSRNPYEFKLLIRGSRDGFDPNTFWEMCNEYAGTVVVMKVKDTDEILGGYNPIAWDKESTNRKVLTSNSFIFSLRNGNVPNSILSRVKNNDMALWYYPQHKEGGYGPWFGNGNLGMKTNCSDFTKDSRCSAKPYTKWYEVPIRESDDWFSIDEYEVFLVSKKKNIEVSDE